MTSMIEGGPDAGQFVHDSGAVADGPTSPHPSLLGFRREGER